jgi:hypothetical protein
MQGDLALYNSDNESEELHDDEEDDDGKEDGSDDDDESLENQEHLHAPFPDELHHENAGPSEDEEDNITIEELGLAFDAADAAMTDSTVDSESDAEFSENWSSDEHLADEHPASGIGAASSTAASSTTVQVSKYTYHPKKFHLSAEWVLILVYH